MKSFEESYKEIETEALKNKQENLFDVFMKKRIVR